MAILNSNPEILLRKRKNNDRKRLEKQEQARERQAQQKKKNQQRAKKFIRAETLVSNNKSNELEKKRIHNITEYENQKKQQISEGSTKDIEPKLLFIIRIPDHTKGLKVPSKARKVLQLLRLNKPNTGVFVKLNSTTLPLLKLISPYIAAGKPSLNSIRKLFQKRACISVIDEETKLPKIIKLDNNAVVEEKFGDDLGFICIEDLVHEIIALGDNFKTVTFWLMPFKLNTPVSGWGPQAKLAKLEYANEHERKVSLAGDAKLIEIDIDQFIDEQN